MNDDDPFDALGAAAELDAALTGGDASTAALEADLVVIRARLLDTERALAAADARAARAEDGIARAGERLARAADLELARKTERVFLDVISAIDDLDRAVETARTAGSPLLPGLELVQKSFLAALAAHGVTPIAAAGQSFDPAVHEAITVVPSDSDATVVAVLRTGYRLREKLLRPAGVVVGKRG